jgi:hypothetical protein
MTTLANWSTRLHRLEGRYKDARTTVLRLTFDEGEPLERFYMSWWGVEGQPTMFDVHMLLFCEAARSLRGEAAPCEDPDHKHQLCQWPLVSSLAAVKSVMVQLDLPGEPIIETIHVAGKICRPTQEAK